LPVVESQQGRAARQRGQPVCGQLIECGALSRTQRQQATHARLAQSAQKDIGERRTALAIARAERRNAV
jgi:hypothetical protein